ncbi:DUF6461 domain-containing protein [Streptomyces sp. NPDC056704]|uniref:DUF6461 domain-containing protein n=1 Tax=Streptomyces sp. NPDC056704 TaxID=3345917 RepID=UPI00369739BA
MREEPLADLASLAAGKPGADVWGGLGGGLGGKGRVRQCSPGEELRWSRLLWFSQRAREAAPQQWVVTDCPVRSDWTLVLQFDGGVGMRPRFLEALSAAGRAVTHSSNGGAHIDLFHWYEAGELRTSFEWPTDWYGSTPDELVPLMREIGFDLTEDGTGPSTDTKAAVLALAEPLTGVRLTEELLKDAEYHFGQVPEKPAEEWTKFVIDITDAHGERFYKEVTRAEVEAASARARAEAEAPIVILGPSSPAP